MTRVFIWKNNSPQEWEEISFSAFSKARRNGCFTGRFFVETVKMFRDEDDRIIMECSRKDFEKYQQEDRHSRYLQEHEKSRSIFPASHVGDRDGTEEGYQDMKKHGHYCKVCGEYKANEKFSGKGHASHICKSCASLPAEKQAELMTLNRLLNLPWRLSKEQLSWLKNRLKDRRPDVRALAQEQYEMRFPPRHLEDDEFNFFDEESFIE